MIFKKGFLVRENEYFRMDGCGVRMVLRFQGHRFYQGEKIFS